MPIGDLIANYVYDLYGRNYTNLKKYETGIENLKNALRKEQNSELNTEKNHAKRKWKLSLPKEEYVGVYFNKKIGTVEVLYENGNNIAKIGNLTAIATPLTLADCMRLEFVPGSGSGICFKISEAKVESLSYLSEVFTKIK
jgi:hypothetical protein